MIIIINKIKQNNRSTDNDEFSKYKQLQFLFLKICNYFHLDFGLLLLLLLLSLLLLSLFRVHSEKKCIDIFLIIFKILKSVCDFNLSMCPSVFLCSSSSKYFSIQQKVTKIADKTTQQRSLLTFVHTNYINVTFYSIKIYLIPYYRNRSLLSQNF